MAFILIGDIGTCFKAYCKYYLNIIMCSYTEIITCQMWKPYNCEYYSVLFGQLKKLYSFCSESIVCVKDNLQSSDTLCDKSVFAG